MIAFIVVSQLAIGALAPAQKSAGSYSTPALRDFVAAVAESNRRVPELLAAYGSRVESEAALLTRDTVGREELFLAEQYAAQANWSREQGRRIHLIGYRAPGKLPRSSLLKPAVGWTVTSLYGDRFFFRMVVRREPWNDDAARPYKPGVRDTIEGVHPMATDRDAYYRFEGGDTVATLRLAGRSIPLVEVRVTPVRRKVGAREDYSTFEGVIYVDASRHQIVRMRGRVERAPRSDGTARLARLTTTVRAIYVDITNGELEGDVWLPTTERIDLEGGSGLAGGTHLVMRYIATFRNYSILRVTEPAGDNSVDRATESPVPSPMPRQRTAEPLVLTSAPRDSLAAFDDWTLSRGTATTRVTTADFADLAPPLWSRSGPPKVVFDARSTARLVHVDRVEGLFTGVEGALHLGDAAPGVTARAFGGWAWAEATARGGGSLSLERGRWTTALAAERALASTNDFTRGRFAGGRSQPPLFSLAGDQHDYVDRRTVSLSTGRVLGATRSGIATMQIGAGRDRGERVRVGLERFNGTPRSNRGSVDGSYARVAIDYELNSSASAWRMTPGFGGALHYEAAAGELAWQRATVRLDGRRRFGALSVQERFDAGVVVGKEIPAQQLFELGGRAGLRGYDYKEFAGDRAALVRASANYRLPFLPRPIMRGGWLSPMQALAQRVSLASLAPGIGVGIDAGWTCLSSDAARSALTVLGTSVDGAPISRASGSVRGSFAFGMTLFDGLVHAGAARALENGSKWRAVVGIGVF